MMICIQNSHVIAQYSFANVAKMYSRRSKLLMKEVITSKGYKENLLNEEANWTKFSLFILFLLCNHKSFNRTICRG